MFQSVMQNIYSGHTFPTHITHILSAFNVDINTHHKNIHDPYNYK